jgi:DNA-binding XRE family transcriptional regulator
MISFLPAPDEDATIGSNQFRIGARVASFAWHGTRGTKLAQRPVDVIVGARLSALRTVRGVSQDALGAAIGTTGSEIANYESGAVRIPAAHLIEICRFFQVKLEDLFPSSDPDRDPNLH